MIWINLRWQESLNSGTFFYEIFNVFWDILNILDGSKPYVVRILWYWYFINVFEYYLKSRLAWIICRNLIEFQPLFTCQVHRLTFHKDNFTRTIINLGNNIWLGIWQIKWKLSKLIYFCYAESYCDLLSVCLVVNLKPILRVFSSLCQNKLLYRYLKGIFFEFWSPKKLHIDPEITIMTLLVDISLNMQYHLFLFVVSERLHFLIHLEAHFNILARLSNFRYLLIILFSLLHLYIWGVHD